MKEVLINGVTYLPASSLAKQFRYTSDYIGQLCRAKKVDAQLIGRSWYVNPDSLAGVREKRYSRHLKTTVKGGATHEVSINTEIVPVESPLAKATIKMQVLPQATNFAKRIDWKPLRYEGDESDLLPTLSKQFKPKSIKVDLADSADITIKKSTKSTILVPDELPTVTLRGKVKIASLEEAFDLTEELLEEDALAFPESPLPVVSPSLDASPEFRPKAILKPSKRPTSADALELIDNNYAQVVSSGFNMVEWSLITVNILLLVTAGLVAFSEISLTATTLNFVQNFEFETRSLQALLGQYWQ